MKLPVRKKSSSKIDGGHTIIVGGSKKFIGASILSALAATKVGSGYIHLMSDLKKFDVLKYPDFILHDFNLKELDHFKNESFAIGPGLGIDKLKIKIVKKLANEKFSNVVLDADALTILSRIKIQIPPTWILTPHEGEAARLLEIDSKEVQKNRMASLKKCMRNLNVILF